MMYGTTGFCVYRIYFIYLYTHATLGLRKRKSKEDSVLNGKCRSQVSNNKNTISSLHIVGTG